MRPSNGEEPARPRERADATVRGMAEVTIFHNRQCSTSRHAMDVLDRLGIGVDVVEYLRTPLDVAALRTLIDELEDPVADLVRKDSYFKELGLAAADYTTPEAVVELLIEHPRLMQRPVLVKSGRAIIGRPKDRVEPFLRN
jgi:arsenate reductase (glutaredoxin)